MARLLKALLGRPYSYDDLVKESAQFTSNPRLPEGLPDVLAHFDGQKQTFLEFIQLTFKDFLRQIADKPTRADQRAELISLHLQELSWRADEKAARDAKHVDSWAHFTKGSRWFEAYPQTEWKRLLIGRFMASLIIGSWLTVLGRRLYKLEDHLESAFDLYVDYDTEIKTMDVGMLELMLENLANHDDDQGMLVANFKDEVVNPLMQEQYVILDRLAADIKANTINVDFYRAQFARIDEIKQHIARTLGATTK